MAAALEHQRDESARLPPTIPTQSKPRRPWGELALLGGFEKPDKADWQPNAHPTKSGHDIILCYIILYCYTEIE